MGSRTHLVGSQVGLVDSHLLVLPFVFFGLVGIWLHFLFFGAKAGKAAEGAVVLAVEPGLLAAEEFEMGRFAGARSDGVHGAVARVVVCVVTFEDALVADFVVDGGGLDGERADLVPSGDDHTFDEGHLSGSGGLKFGFVVAKERVEKRRGFALDQNGSRESGSSGAIEGGDAFARGRGGSFGELRVGAVGSEAFF